MQAKRQMLEGLQAQLAQFKAAAAQGQQPELDDRYLVAAEASDPLAYGQALANDGDDDAAGDGGRPVELPGFISRLHAMLDQMEVQKESVDAMDLHTGDDPRQAVATQASGNDTDNYDDDDDEEEDADGYDLDPNSTKQERIDIIKDLHAKIAYQHSLRDQLRAKRDEQLHLMGSSQAQAQSRQEEHLAPGMGAIEDDYEYAAVCAPLCWQFFPRIVFIR